MQINLENIEELTELYLNNSLSEHEKVVFEDALTKDIALQQAFEEYSDAILAVELSGIKNELNELFEKEKNQKETPVIPFETNWKKYAGIAASLLLFFSLGYFFFLQKSKNEKLYTEFFYKDEGLPVTMGVTNKNEFNDAMVDYKSDNYKNAAQKWGKLLTKNPTNDTVQYYLAMSFLNESETKESIPLLEKVLDRKETAFRNEAEYFLALAYLKNNQIEKAKNVLKYSQHEKAKELLERLR